jgi:hypothetical protein
MIFSLFHKLIWSPLEKELNQILNKKKHIIYLCVILLDFIFFLFYDLFYYLFHKWIWAPLEKELNQILKKKHITKDCTQTHLLILSIF